MIFSVINFNNFGPILSGPGDLLLLRLDIIFIISVAITGSVNMLQLLIAEEQYFTKLAD